MFWTIRGMRKDCLVSPYLFNLLIAELKEEMKKGGLRLEGRKIYTLAYANGVLINKRREWNEKYD